MDKFKTVRKIKIFHKLKVPNFRREDIPRKTTFKRLETFSWCGEKKRNKRKSRKAVRTWKRVENNFKCHKLKEPVPVIFEIFLRSDYFILTFSSFYLLIKRFQRREFQLNSRHRTYFVTLLNSSCDFRRRKDDFFYILLSRKNWQVCEKFLTEKVVFG